jgi:general secretion pathway protein G
MTCPNCNNSNPDSARFCAYCGATLAVRKQPPPFPDQAIQQQKPQPKKSSNKAGIAIAIGVGCFVLFIIIGIVAAIAIPNLLNAIQRGKQKRTMADIRTIATACEAYGVNQGYYPDAKSISELKSFLVPDYVLILPEKDGWERNFAYQAWKADESQKGPTSYMIVSFGKDGIADGKEYYEGVTIYSFNNDIVFSDGTFWQHPEHLKQ